MLHQMKKHTFPQRARRISFVEIQFFPCGGKEVLREAFARRSVWWRSCVAEGKSILIRRSADEACARGLIRIREAGAAPVSRSKGTHPWWWAQNFENLTCRYIKKRGFKILVFSGVPIFIRPCHFQADIFLSFCIKDSKYNFSRPAYHAKVLLLQFLIQVCLCWQSKGRRIALSRFVRQWRGTCTLRALESLY